MNYFKNFQSWKSCLNCSKAFPNQIAWRFTEISNFIQVFCWICCFLNRLFFWCVCVLPKCLKRKKNENVQEVWEKEAQVLGKRIKIMKYDISSALFFVVNHFRFPRIEVQSTWLGTILPVIQKLWLKFMPNKNNLIHLSITENAKQAPYQLIVFWANII